MAGPCDEMFGGCTDSYKKRFGFAWKRGAGGFTYFSQEFRVLPSWSPGVWKASKVVQGNYQTRISQRPMYA